MNFHILEYLDLETDKHRNVKVSLTERIKANCNKKNLENQFKHIPHISNSQ